jgi:hypothetical protein
MQAPKIGNLEPQPPKSQQEVKNVDARGEYEKTARK